MPGFHIVFHDHSDKEIHKTFRRKRYQVGPRWVGELGRCQHSRELAGPTFSYQNLVADHENHG